MSDKLNEFLPSFMKVLSLGVWNMKVADLKNGKGGSILPSLLKLCPRVIF